MLVLITYDISTETVAAKKRLNKIAKICKSKGQRVQNSCFECFIDWGSWLDLKQKLLFVINKKEDSIRFYLLGNRWKNRVEHIGTKITYTPEDTLIV